MTKKFITDTDNGKLSIKYVGDPTKSRAAWRKYYLSLLKESEKEFIKEIQVTLFSKSRKVNYRFSKDFIIEYFIFNSIKNEGIKFLFPIVPKWRIDLIEGLIKRANECLAMLHKSINNINKESLRIPNDEVLDEYKSINHQSYSIRLDNENRLIYRPIPEANKVEFIQCMFHYDDPPKSAAQEKLYEIFDSLKDSKDYKDLTNNIK